MKLNWNRRPEPGTVHRALSAAYQYELIDYVDGRAELNVQHRGDAPNAEPIKNFVYKSRNAAFGGAQRFEDQHGYRDPANHAPAEIVPFLRPFSKRTRHFIEEVQHRAQGTAPIDSDIEDATMRYDELCTELLCCRIYDCYNRTEIDTLWCVEHSGQPTEDD
jgi:hypothetical protein